MTTGGDAIYKAQNANHRRLVKSNGKENYKRTS